VVWPTRYIDNINPVCCQDFVLATSTVREGQNYRAASASKDGSVRMWDLKTGVTQFVIQGHKNTGTSNFSKMYFFCGIDLTMSEDSDVT
jgi:WD40 repeat protein